MSLLSNEIRTRLALTELKEIDEDIVRLWSEGNIADLERLSDAALIEYLLRADLGRLRAFRDQLFLVLNKRPCLRVLVNERTNVQCLCTGELKNISERLCHVFHGSNEFYTQAGLVIGGILVGFGSYWANI